MKLKNQIGFRLYFLFFALVFSNLSLAESPAVDPMESSQKKMQQKVLGTILPVAEKKSEKIELNVSKFVLKNGLTVLLLEDRRIPMISYQTWFRVGAKDEPKGQSGIAHMLEHMMFKGAKKYTDKDFDRILHENGITNNAFTSFDYTGYYENLPSDKLDLIIDVEVDRLAHVALKPEHLASEREVVKEERRMRVDNDPVGSLWENLYGLVFANHPYGIPVIGLPEDIDAYTSEKLREFYNQWYNPRQAVLVVVGDFSTPQLKEKITKRYQDIPDRPPIKRDTPVLPEQTASREKLVRKNIQAPSLAMAFPTAPEGHPDSYALDLLGEILGGGKSSPIQKRLSMVEQSVIYSFTTHHSLKDSGILAFGAMLKPKKDQARVVKVIEEEIEKIKTREISAAELTKATNQFKAALINQVKTIDGKARMLAASEIIYGDYQKFFKLIDQYDLVTPLDIKRVANLYLKKERSNKVFLLPETK